MDIHSLIHTSSVLRQQSRWQHMVQLLEVDQTHWKEKCRGSEWGSVLCYNLFTAYFYLQQFDRCVTTLQDFVTYLFPVLESVVQGTSFLLEKWPGYTSLVATTDVTRQSQHAGELVICYGNFPLTAQTIVPLENRILRHAVFFPLARHTAVEFHPCWNEVAVIYFLNLNTRQDRLLSIWVELCRMGAPLDRVRPWRVPPTTGSPHLSCSENHTAIAQDFVRAFGGSGKHALILEDDFTFTSEVALHQQHLAAFFERSIEYDVCFLALSQPGLSEPYDDLLRITHHPVTTTSGYLLHANTASRVAAVFAEGTQKLRVTRDFSQFAVDRYWVQKLHSFKRMFVFVKKMGYQLPSYSDHDKRINCKWE